MGRLSQKWGEIQPLPTSRRLPCSSQALWRPSSSTCQSAMVHFDVRILEAILATKVLSGWSADQRPMPSTPALVVAWGGRCQTLCHAQSSLLPNT
eukprot:1777227-Pyramimonas_sp.AAC.1